MDRESAANLYPYNFFLENHERHFCQREIVCITSQYKLIQISYHMNF